MSDATAQIVNSAVTYDALADWLAARATVLGGSDVSALFGAPDENGRVRSANPYKSEYELWLEKLGLVDASKKETEAMYWGKVLEPYIAQRYREETGRAVELLGFTICQIDACPYLGVTPDAVIAPIDERGPGILSIKNVDLMRWKRQAWDEELPPFIQIQLQAELAVRGAAWGSFALLVGGNRFHWQDVDRNDRFIEVLFKRVAVFKRRIDEHDAPAIDASERTADALKRLYCGNTGETVKLDEEFNAVAAELERAKVEGKDAAERERGARSKLMAAIGNAALAELADGTFFKRTIIEKKPYTVTPKPYPELRRINK